jgi:demethoxyubiquinone hydroxylase (CLK1/Coq7/Cat5 family)
MSTVSASCTVYYDGGCPLCRREIAHYRRRAGALPIAWVDASACDPDALGADLPRSAALSRLHVRTADGSLVSGAAAFAALWARVPGYRWLAAVAAQRPAMAGLEAAYRAFLRLRPLWRRADVATPAERVALPVADDVCPAPRLVAVANETNPEAQPAVLPRTVLADLRTGHASQAGAVQVYRGVLGTAGDGDLRAFAARQLAARHLDLQRIRRWVPRTERSRLLPLWRGAGWLAGAVPALLGPRAVFATVAAVERSLARQHAGQLERLAAYPELAELRASLAARRPVEVQIRGEALALRRARAGIAGRLWGALVGKASALAVAASRRW